MCFYCYFFVRRWRHLLLVASTTRARFASRLNYIKGLFICAYVASECNIRGTKQFALVPIIYVVKLNDTNVVFMKILNCKNYTEEIKIQKIYNKY